MLLAKHLSMHFQLQEYVVSSKTVARVPTTNKSVIAPVSTWGPTHVHHTS